MARIAPVASESATTEQQEHLRQLQATRGGRVSNIFLTLAKVPALSQGVLAMATSLRQSTLLSRRLRELAIVAVGIETGSRYELLHHWKAALAAGIEEAELLAITGWATSDRFTREECAVIAFAVELTRDGAASPGTWANLGFLIENARLELVLTVSWYNCVARMAGALDLELDDGLDELVVPEMAFPP